MTTTMSMITRTRTTSTTEANGQKQEQAMQEREPVPDALKRFIWDIQSMVELADSEREILLIGRDLMRRLVASDNWLPAVFATPAPDGCLHYQLYRDDQERFTVVSTVLAAGQSLPIVEDHVWEIAGVLRGAIERQRFALADDGKPAPNAEPATVGAGSIITAPARKGEATQVANALTDSVSICIQVYGGELGTLARRTFAAGGEPQDATVVYANGEHLEPYDILSIQTRIVD